MAALSPRDAVTARMGTATAEQTVAALDVIARFENAVDAGDSATFAAMFTDDGRVTGSLHIEHDDLAGFLREDRNGPSRAHLTANHTVVQHDPRNLRVDYVLMVIELGGPSPAIQGLNRITDDLVATPDGWRIRRHHVAPFLAEDHA